MTRCPKVGSLRLQRLDRLSQGPVRGRRSSCPPLAHLARCGSLEVHDALDRALVYRGDDHHAYAGTGALVMVTLRNLTLGLLRLAGIAQITRTRQRIAADRTRIFLIIAAASSTNRP
jgi:hypothetical protein